MKCPPRTSETVRESGRDAPPDAPLWGMKATLMLTQVPARPLVRAAPGPHAWVRPPLRPENKSSPPEEGRGGKLQHTRPSVPTLRPRQAAALTVPR